MAIAHSPVWRAPHTEPAPSESRPVSPLVPTGGAVAPASLTVIASKQRRTGSTISVILPSAGICSGTLRASAATTRARAARYTSASRLQMGTAR